MDKERTEQKHHQYKDWNGKEITVGCEVRLSSLGREKNVSKTKTTQTYRCRVTSLEDDGWVSLEPLEFGKPGLSIKMMPEWLVVE